MKKLLAVALVAIASVASAAWEKIGTVQVADLTSLVGGITKLGEFTGNQMLGLMASSAVSEMPCIKLFGPGRENVPFALPLFWDGENFEYAVLYPIAQTQAEFLTMHPGKVGKDGVITLTPDEDDEGGATNGVRYVLFSQDGKWAAVSDKKAQLAPALKDVKLAERPMKGDLAKLVVGKNGMGTIRKMIAEAEKKAETKDRAKMKEVLKDCESLACGLAVDDKGLAVRGKLNAVKGSKLAACGLKPLADNPFAFAGKDALVAYAIAADCGQASIEYKAICDLLAKYGVKTDFIAAEEKDGVGRYTLDIPAAVAYFKGATNELAKIDGKKLKADFDNLFGKGDSFAVENPAMSGSLAVKGYTTAAAPAERVKAVLPEIADKKPYNLQTWSLYAIVKAVLPHVLNGLEPKDRQMFAPILATLPPEGKGGIVSAQWREKDAHRFVFRVSADEFKSVSAGFSAFAAYQMQQAMKEQSAQPGKGKSAPAK